MFLTHPPSEVGVAARYPQTILACYGVLAIRTHALIHPLDSRFRSTGLNRILLEPLMLVRGRQADGQARPFFRYASAREMTFPKFNGVFRILLFAFHSRLHVYPDDIRFFTVKIFSIHRDFFASPRFDKTRFFIIVYTRIRSYLGNGNSGNSHTDSNEIVI